MIALDLYWKHDGADIRLGTGYHEVLPPVGSLLTFVCNHGTCWRVKLLYFHLIAEGSMAHRQAMDGRRRDWPRPVVFVEPAEGPHEP